MDSSPSFFMQRCLGLAQLALGQTQTNPLVGSVIVHNNKIIGEGWHQKYGAAHAEVNAIASVKQVELLKSSTLYVNLEPCSHFGKTPPCADLIITSKIPRVIIGCQDSFSIVNGLGIRKLQDAGVEVKVGVLEKECKIINKRFFTFHEKKRPYIILKWAQTADGFIDKIRTKDEVALKISSDITNHFVHQWRSQEQAILIGKNTLINDNPSLNARFGFSPSPTIVVLGYESNNWKIMQNSVQKLIFSNLELKLPYTKFFPKQCLSGVLNTLYKENVCSLLVEGGANVLNSFLNEGIWDEIRIIQNNININEGVKSPNINNLYSNTSIEIGSNEIRYYSQ